MKLIKAAIALEEKMDVAVDNHKLLKAAIAIEENTAKYKKIFLGKAVLGLFFLKSKLKIK